MSTKSQDPRPLKDGDRVRHTISGRRGTIRSRHPNSNVVRVQWDGRTSSVRCGIRYVVPADD